MIDYTVGLSPDPGGLVIRNPALGAGNNEYINIKSFLTVFPMRTWYEKRNKKTTFVITTPTDAIWILLVSSP